MVACKPCAAMSCNACNQHIADANTCCQSNAWHQAALPAMGPDLRQDALDALTQAHVAGLWIPPAVACSHHLPHGMVLHVSCQVVLVPLVSPPAVVKLGVSVSI